MSTSLTGQRHGPPTEDKLRPAGYGSGPCRRIHRGHTLKTAFARVSGFALAIRGPVRFRLGDSPEALRAAPLGRYRASMASHGVRSSDLEPESEHRSDLRQFRED